MGIIHKKGLKMHLAVVCGDIKTREPLCLPFAAECVVGEVLSLRGVHTHTQLATLFRRNWVNAHDFFCCKKRHKDIFW